MSMTFQFWKRSQLESWTKNINISIKFIFFLSLYRKHKHSKHTLKYLLTNFDEFHSDLPYICKCHLCCMLKLFSLNVLVWITTNSYLIITVFLKFCHPTKFNYLSFDSIMLFGRLHSQLFVFPLHVSTCLNVVVHHELSQLAIMSSPSKAYLSIWYTTSCRKIIKLNIYAFQSSSCLLVLCLVNNLQCHQLFKIFCFKSLDLPSRH